MLADHPTRVRFAEFDLDSAQGVLRKNGEIIKLAPQPFKALTLLASRPGEIVTRDELRQALWGNEVAVDFEHSLNTCIRQVRSALGEDAGRARIIETIPKLGYRLKAPVSRVSTAPRRSWFSRAAVGAAAVAAIVAAVSWWATRRDWESVPKTGNAGNGATTGTGVSPTPSRPARQVVVVLGFRNLAQRADAEWLSAGLSEMVATELASGGTLRVISADAIAQSGIGLNVGKSDGVSPDDLRRLRQRLGADLVVFGSYSVVGRTGGQKIRLDLRVQDTTKHAMLPPVSEAGSEADLFDLVWRVGAAVRNRLGVQPLSAEQVMGLRASLPSNARAARAYVEGLTSLRAREAERARTLLEQAVRLQPDYAPARSALSSAWWRLGDVSKARAEGERAFELSRNLSREEQLVIEGRYRTVLNERDRILAICRTLFEFYPDNLEYGLMLVQAYGRLNKREDALATIDTLRRLPSPASDDIGLDFAEASAARLGSDLKRAMAAATRAADKAEALGSRELLASARLAQAATIESWGRTREAIAYMTEAAQIFEATRDRRQLAITSMSMARLFAKTGDMDGARKMYESAAATFREIGDADSAIVALSNLGAMLSQRGNLTGARTVYEQALRAARASPDRRSGIEPLCSVAEILMRQGEMTAARARFEEVVSVSRTIDRNYNLGPRALRGIATIALLQGDVQTAKAMNERALAISREGAHPADLGLSLSSLALVLLAQADLGGARRVIEEGESIPIRPSSPSDQLVGGAVDLARAALAIEEGRWQHVAETAERAADRFRAADEPEDAASAYEMLARGWLAQRNQTEAQRAIDRAEEMSKASQNRLLHASIDTTAARVAAMSGNAAAIADAIKAVEAIITDTGRRGVVGRQLEARLALGEIEIASGRHVAGRARLETLQRDATSRGLMLIARKAANASTTTAPR